MERVDPDAFVVRLEDTERAVLASLLDDLDRLLDEAGDPEREVTPVVTRLFPPAFTDHEGRDAERDEEYQRLMREELIVSRRAAIAESRSWLTGEQGERRISESELTSMMRSLNSLRLVLGSILGILPGGGAVIAS
ncbi:MAG: DUF2017 family protein, partial [Ilumatobacter sp.]